MANQSLNTKAGYELLCISSFVFDGSLIEHGGFFAQSLQL
jgi:hypothetical protein